VQGGGENEMSENSNGSVKEVMPNTEVVAKAKRKRFSAAHIMPARKRPMAYTAKG
jgi:hypothetical protein